MRASLLRHYMNVWPPFLAAGIRIAELLAATASGEKNLRWFEVEVRDREGDVVARVRKQLYVRRKRPKPEATLAGGD